MSIDTIGQGRRRFLVQSTSVIGGAGIVAAAVPFVNSMSISARARAVGAPVEVDIGKLEAGRKLALEWRGQPVWVVYRTDRMMGSLETLRPQLADPESEASEQPAYAGNPVRARASHPAILVFIPICTHLGCIPSYRPEVRPADLGQDWLGGFFCPCHGSRYDLAARVYRGQPAPSNMAVPPYTYMSDTRLLIGEDDMEEQPG
jgi:ubiquinol-cytochrome c reductase iron-sulfur subunit